jgi:hypothetical protein
VQKQQLHQALQRIFCLAPHLEKEGAGNEEALFCLWTRQLVFDEMRKDRGFSPEEIDQLEASLFREAAPPSAERERRFFENICAAAAKLCALPSFVQILQGELGVYRSKKGGPEEKV